MSTERTFSPCSSAAFAWLMKAYEQGDGMTRFGWAPAWRGLRDDPRYTEMLRKLNLPPR